MIQNHSKDEFYRALRESARYLHQNRPGEALERLLPFYEKGIDDPDIAINIGGSYILQRKWTKAVKILKTASETYPDNVMVWTNLAAAYLGRLEIAGPRQQKQAIQAYEQALTIDPKTANVHYHLGLIYKEQGELNRACTFFQRAIEVNPADRDAIHWLERLEKISAAVSQAQEAEVSDRTANNIAHHSADDTD